MSPDSLLLFIGVLYPFCSCCVYIPPHPALARHRKYSRPFPRFDFTRPPPLAPHLTSITNSQPCHWSHAGPTWTESLRLALHSLLYPHTHTLSLSLSQRQWDNNHVYRPLVCSFMCSLFGSAAWVLFSFFFPFRTHTRSPTPLHIWLPQ